MSDLSIISALKDWIIPLLAVTVSVWFAASAKKDAERADALLSQIKESVEGSQKRMIDSAIGILDSLPQVMSGKAIFTITRSIELTLETIRENISNPKGLPKEEHDQNIIALSSHLSILLEHLKSLSK